MEHVEACSEIWWCDNIRKYAMSLKEENIRDWEPEERLKAITEFALLTIQMKNLYTPAKPIWCSRSNLPSTSRKRRREVGRRRRTRWQNPARRWLNSSQQTDRLAATSTTNERPDNPTDRTRIDFPRAPPSGPASQLCKNYLLFSQKSPVIC